MPAASRPVGFHGTGIDAARKGTQVENLCYGTSEGLPVPREPALLTERSHDGEARSASSERRAG